MSARFPWGVLGIASTDDRKTIRSAYAARLKLLDVDADVAAFEELRAAREEALYLAAEGNAPGPDLGGLADDPAPTPDIEWDAPLTADELLPQEPLAQSGSAPIPATVTEAAPAQPYDERPDRFLALLYPGGEYSATPLTAADYARAEVLQRELIAEAQAAAIDQQHSIELWLAHHLASAWPRSGPLVEESGAAFGWDRAAGLLDENPAVAFLNNRLSAIAFVHQLDQTDHPLHEEWTELRKPGTRSPIPWRKARVDKMQTLLGTIRTHHPEVEEYLSPQRVASWGGSEMSSGGGSGFNWSWVFGAVFLLSMIGRCANTEQDSPPGYSAPEAPAEVTAWRAEQRLGLVNEVLGGATEADLVLLDHDQSPMWNELRIVTRYPAIEADEPAGRMVERVRGWILIAAPDAPFALLVQAKQVKLELMRLALAGSGADACVQVSQAGLMPPSLRIPDDLRNRERALARAMLDAGLFDSVPQGGRSFEANIPGEIFEAARNEAGLSEADAVLAATGQGTNTQQCTFRIALAEQVLRRPGDVSADLLRIL